MNFVRCHHCHKTCPTPYSVTEIQDDGTVTTYKLCDRCGESLSNNKPKEEEPKSEGLDLTQITTPDQLFEFITGITRPVAPEIDPCECGLTEGEFDKSGLFGCEKCYGHFTNKMEDLVYPYHQGARRHVGKKPKVNRETLTKEALLIELSEAIRLEEYERAAEIKQKLNQLAD